MNKTYDFTNLDLAHAMKLMSTEDGLPWVAVYIRTPIVSGRVILLQ